MSKMVIEKGYFSDRAQVMRDIAETGYWPTTFVSGASPELPIHYHDHDIIGYVIEGRTYLLDEDGNRIEIAPGDRMVIPKGAWHAEGEVEGEVVYIVSMRDPVPFHEGIMPREPRGAFPELTRKSMPT
jgi:uncharacterized cupin superfamily protein